MKMKKLTKLGIAMILAAALAFEPGVAASAAFDADNEQDCRYEEDLLEAEDLIEEASGDTEGGEEEAVVSDSEIWDLDEAEDLNEDDEESDTLASEDQEEIVLEEEATPDDEMSLEESFITDVSGNEVLEYVADAIDADAEKAAGKSGEREIIIKQRTDRLSSETDNYYLKFNKDGSLKSAVLTLDTNYSSIRLMAIQTDKDGENISEKPVWKSSNEKVVTTVMSGQTVTLKAVSKGKATITCYAGDGSGDKSKISIEVRQGVTSLEIAGQSYIAPGKGATLKAAAYPKKANNKKVTWSLKEDIPGIKISPTSGNITVKKDVARNTTFTVIATAGDCSGVSAEKEITVREKATKVSISGPATGVIATHEAGDLKRSISFTASTDNNEIVSWKVSDAKKGRLTIDGNKATLTALAPGNVTVTAFANDGSKKKAAVKIKVIIPVSDISIKAPKDRQDDKLAVGSSLQFTPVIGTKYGKPGNSKVRWEYEIIGYEDMEQTTEKDIDDETMEMILKKRYLFTFANGKITAVSQEKYEKQARELYRYCKCNSYGIKVTAYTTDGSNLKSETRVVKILQH